MTPSFISSPRLSSGYLRACLIIGVLGLVPACQTTGGKDVSGFQQLNLAPGDTGNCNSSPCQVFLQIPAGTGSYEVTGIQVKIGVYPAGQKADLGGLWESQVIEIKGMDVPKTYVYIPTRP